MHHICDCCPLQARHQVESQYLACVGHSKLEPTTILQVDVYRTKAWNDSYWLSVEIGDTFQVVGSNKIFLVKEFQRFHTKMQILKTCA